MEPESLEDVFGKGDTVIMKRLQLPDMRKKWNEIFGIMDNKKLRLSEKGILAEVQASRKEKGPWQRMRLYSPSTHYHKGY